MAVMIKATHEDKDLVAGLLTRSFENNQTINYLIPKGKNRISRIGMLMQYAFYRCHLQGDVFLSQDRRACALVLYPHLERATLTTISLEIQLILKGLGLGNCIRVLKYRRMTKTRLGKTVVARIWMLGVSPRFQSLGNGSRLLQDVILEMQKKNLPVYLETPEFSQVAWYERFGFMLYNTYELGHNLYFLKRVADKG
ncbi:GNAT family N-acetyltransferase [Pedobacter alluvionis]|uniref:GNAT family N-acetyltransferase n=2 Tax=Pedobacter alluvionis TaxID=475253 RepID=A0ABY2HI12_9SPHI|nr:GNAT family N-acetyltransferase [Pedobacter alluvionis]